MSFPTSKSDPDARYAVPGWIGDWGMQPWEPCRECGNDGFTTMDWGMGYRCSECNTLFGTPEEHREYSDRKALRRQQQDPKQ